jgi:uncharacterized protein (TIGR00299 family) protein
MSDRLRIRLDPIGGVAGDMFVASLLDAFPDRAPLLDEALGSLTPPEGVSWRVEAAKVSGFAGRRFQVSEPHAKGHGHYSYKSLIRLIGDAGLAAPVRDRALDIYARLAEAEAAVHGGSLDDVVFHEVGAWDSVVDVVAAACLIESLSPVEWFCGPLPIGRGAVRTAHGAIPVPAPAALRLLRGMPVVDDGIEGERITPTGAAILAHIAPRFDTFPAGRLLGAGYGFGARALPGRLNALRMIVFAAAPQRPEVATEEMVRLSCDLDDQTPEDVAIAVDRLRLIEGVVDVTTSVAAGKKGRIALRLDVLARPECLPEAQSQLLEQTTSLGIRWHTVYRAVLPRGSEVVETSAGPVRRKRADRSAGPTFKAESDDIAALGDTHEARKRIRIEAEDGDR